MPGLTPVIGPAVPRGSVLIEALFALLLLGVSGMALVLLLVESLRQVRVTETVSEMLPSLSQWVLEASPGDAWTNSAGAEIRWDREGWLQVHTLPGGGVRALRWPNDQSPQESSP